MTGSRMTRFVLRLYPAHHRDEVATTLADVLETRGRAGAARELFDTVAYALRQRTRLTSTSTAGAVASLAAPAAAASAIALSVMYLLYAEWRWRYHPDAVNPFVRHFGPFETLGPLVYVFWCLVLVAAGLGYHRAARSLTACAVVTAAAMVPVAAMTGIDRPPLHALGAITILGCIALAAPTDPLRPPPLRGRPLLISTAILFAFASLVVVWNYDRMNPYMTSPLSYRAQMTLGPIGMGVGIVLVLALLFALVVRRPHLPAAAIALGIPWVLFTDGVLNPLDRRTTLAHCAVLLLALAVMAALHSRRRTAASAVEAD
ncbi:hypothetical protein [Thermomonospora umbrina]|uniref:Uncharacterized protein n=1 Tax=Thermomonospora umbrina TaxID=111806 RepID=A0A3D9T383_9ACTN|nr:hypothetical protein [Thermomonospora umbrina]REE99715.1 hypothetical protein DFJ69_5230 [Thermomonospora umbrina]